MKQKKQIIIPIATLVIWAGAPAEANHSLLSLAHPIALQSPANGAAPAPKIEMITAENLKSRIAKNEPVTIIDVRATSSFADSDNKIKGAIHYKLRRLKSRLRFPPLKDLPRDREIVTYCACPNDESSIRAAQILIDGGFKRVRVLKGGWTAWLNAKGQLQPRQ